MAWASKSAPPATKDARRRRQDYTPSVRPRAMRELGLRRLSPGYLTDISDTQFSALNVGNVDNNRETLVTPRKGYRLRLVRLQVIQTGADGRRTADVYFGTGTGLFTAPAKAVDLVVILNQSTASTRSWERGTGPIGLVDEVLSIRLAASGTTLHTAIVEYTEER